MSSFLDRRFADLEEYTPGEQPKDTVYTKLNTNESPYPPGPETIRAVTDTELAGRLRLYSDPDSVKLKDALAGRYGVSRENIFVSNGSDDILNFAFMAFGQDGVAFPAISYGFYEVFGALHHRACEMIPLKDWFVIDVDDYKGIGKMVVLANPNAPTGRALTRKQIAEIAASNPEHMVVIDEAYVDFGTESCVPLTKEYDNILVVQTFSKSRSLAGARLGFAVASAPVIADLEKIKYSTNPYNVNSVSCAAGVAAIAEDEYYQANCRRIMETREWAVEEFKKLGFEVVPSLANFIFVTTSRIDGEELYLKLKERKILIRHFDNPDRCEYNRVTIGTPEEIQILLDAIVEILAEKEE